MLPTVWRQLTTLGTNYQMQSAGQKWDTGLFASAPPPRLAANHTQTRLLAPSGG